MDDQRIDVTDPEISGSKTFPVVTSIVTYADPGHLFRQEIAIRRGRDQVNSFGILGRKQYPMRVRIEIGCAYLPCPSPIYAL